MPWPSRPTPSTLAKASPPGNPQNFTEGISPRPSPPVRTHSFRLPPIHPRLRLPHLHAGHRRLPQAHLREDRSRNRNMCGQRRNGRPLLLHHGTHESRIGGHPVRPLLRLLPPSGADGWRQKHRNSPAAQESGTNRPIQQTKA